MHTQHTKKTGLSRKLGGRRGIALLSVLWVLTLLSLMAATFTLTARTETKLAQRPQQAMVKGSIQIIKAAVPPVLGRECINQSTLGC